jgi:hypothetical protein
VETTARSHDDQAVTFWPQPNVQRGLQRQREIEQKLALQMAQFDLHGMSLLQNRGLTVAALMAAVELHEPRGKLAL